MPNQIHKSYLLLMAASLLSFFAQAQETTPKVVSSTENILAIVMILIAVVLAFVIWGMGQVLLVLIKQMMEKAKQASKVAPFILMALFLLVANQSSAQMAAEVAPTPAVDNYGGLNYAGFWTLASVIIIEVVVIMFFMFFIKRIQEELLPETKVSTWSLKAWWSKMDKRFFTKAIAVEMEADVMLDHDYDGIRELDNSLPPWWKYGFYITIVVAVIYLFNFHVFGYGKNPTEEYNTEMEQAKIAMEAYQSMNADKVDESHLQMPSPAGLDEGKEIFTSVCWTCHGKLGEGGTGPNLTDNYWLHKGSLTDVYLSIKHGYPDKGMQAWEKNYSPKQINNLAGYIQTLKGTNPPNSKAPQGDLYAADSLQTTSKDTITTTK
jgi:cytochrome c oxidase cbb3-type subunit 3